MSDKATNHVAEWFGHRVFPQVTRGGKALEDQREKRCPFLSQATREARACVKARPSFGVCTISSQSNGPRQDWLVCPYRGLDAGLLQDVASRLFGSDSTIPGRIWPAPVLARREVQETILSDCAAGLLPIVYFQDKLGGEVSVSKTDRSPEFSFDVTLVELGSTARGLEIFRYGVLELQTMDFHGSYRAVVKNLEDALRLHQDHFHHAVEQNQQWLADRIEGPNISNVFKRTFYQMMLKFKVAQQPHCAGAVFALPEAVWDSWQRHLGAPGLEEANGLFELNVPGRPSFRGESSAWIYVFDVDTNVGGSPSPLLIRKRIATDAQALAHFALEVAPLAAFGAAGPANFIRERIRQRIARWWPEMNLHFR